MTTATRTRNQKPITDELSQLKEDLVAVRDDVGELAGRLFEESRNRAYAAGDSVRHQMNRSIRQTRRSIAQRPVTALAVAAGIGCAIGWLVSHR